MLELLCFTPLGLAGRWLTKFKNKKAYPDFKDEGALLSSVRVDNLDKEKKRGQRERKMANDILTAIPKQESSNI